MTLSPEEFLRRFLQHVLPRGFPRIRYFGWLANRKRKELLPLCRRLLHQQPQPTKIPSTNTLAVWQCPLCHGLMRVVDGSPPRKSCSPKSDWPLSMTRPEYTPNRTSRACLSRCSLNVCPIPWIGRLAMPIYRTLSTGCPSHAHAFRPRLALFSSPHQLLW
jgi:hypothetical protein